MAEPVQGVFKTQKKNGGTLRDPARSFCKSESDPFVSKEVMQKYGLVDGGFVVGEGKRTKRGLALTGVESISGLSPEEYRARGIFKDLVAIDPEERFDLGACGVEAMRMVDLVAPIGKGTRGLIVSPPKAGKTTILEQIAVAIRAQDPQARIVVLLIDERPEEVTHFRRAVQAEVLASSSDQSIEEHIELAELTLAHIRIELECGRDVVVLVDSLTRMGRAFNLGGSGSGRMMSGGVEAGALEIPRRFFGLARKIENGGSVTILATALVDTGSRMDQFIFEEFKGTGNAELILDRSLAEQRLFPAINLPESGTRKEHRLYTGEDMKRIHKFRRVLADREPKEALVSLKGLLEKYSTNAEFLQSIPV